LENDRERELRRAIEALSETEAKDALDYIVRRRERDPVVELLYSAPEDEKGVRDAKAEIERGEILSAEEIRRELT
jgi:hypothetical protein